MSVNKKSPQVLYWGDCGLAKHFEMVMAMCAFFIETIGPVFLRLEAFTGFYR